MTTRAAQQTATEYARVSRDKSGRLRSVSEQSYENRDAVESEGWEWLPTSYAEEGEASASVFGTVTRRGFDALLDDLRADRFPADVLVLWEASRGSRQMRQWVDLIDALQAAGKRLHVTSDERTYDVRKAKDRRDLQDAANEAEYYSGRLSTTLKRAHRANARDGHWSGIAPYGYTRVWAPDGTVSQVPDEATAPFVVEAYEHVAGGGAIAELVKRWNSRGDTGRVWTTQALRVVLLNPAYTGVRTHTPRSRHESRDAKSARTRVTTEHEAAWPPIVDQDVADRVRAIVTDPSRLNHRTTGVRHLLSSIAECGVCGRGLSPKHRQGKTEFVLSCPAGHVQIDEAESDEYVVAGVVGYLQRANLGPVTDHDSTTVLAARQHVTAAEAYLVEVEQAAEQGLSPLMVAKMQTNGEKRLQSAKAELRRLSLPDALSALLPAETMTRAVWDALGLIHQRRVLQALYGQEGVLGSLRVMPGGRGRRVPVEDRIKSGADAPASTSGA